MEGSRPCSTVFPFQGPCLMLSERQVEDPEKTLTDQQRRYESTPRPGEHGGGPVVWGVILWGLQMLGDMGLRAPCYFIPSNSPSSPLHLTPTLILTIPSRSTPHPHHFISFPLLIIAIPSRPTLHRSPFCSRLSVFFASCPGYSVLPHYTSRPVSLPFACA